MSSVSIRSAKELYGGATEGETIKNMVEAVGCYRVYKYANDYGDKVAYTDYTLVRSNDDEKSLLTSVAVHNIRLVYDNGRIVHRVVLKGQVQTQFRRLFRVVQKLASRQ